MIDDLTDITFCEECDHHGEPNGCNRKGGECKAYHAFLDLQAENADLRKRLETAVELKAKVGDTIYMPWVWSGKSGIAVIEVIYIQIFADELEYHTDFETDDLAYSAYYKFGKFRVNDFGEIVFTDRETAEAHLAKLTEGKKDDLD